MKPRRVTYVRRVKNPNLKASFNTTGIKPVVSLYDDGSLETVWDATPMYDTGDFYIVDTVKGVEFSVFGPGNGMMKSFFDFHDAMMYADELQEAWNRADEDTRGLLL